jgi:hypothetical protein
VAKSIVVQDPPGDHVNWAIGVKTTGNSSLNNGKYPDGYFESHGTFVVPANLYEAQLALRLKHKKSPPEKPGNLRGERSGSRSVLLSWEDNSAEEYAFIIEQSNDNGITWTVAGRVSPDVTAFEAENLTTGVSSLFRVKAKNAYGDSPYSETFQYSDSDGITSINHNSAAHPVELRVYPNPISGNASVTFSLNKAESVKLALYDIRGSEHSTLFGGYLNEGLHHFDLHLGDKKAGFYIIRLLAQESAGSKIISLN